MNDLKFIISRIKKLSHYNKFLLEEIHKLQEEELDWINSRAMHDFADNVDKIDRLKSWANEIRIKKANEGFKNLSGAFKNLEKPIKNAVEALNKLKNNARGVI